MSIATALSLPAVIDARSPALSPRVSSTLMAGLFLSLLLSSAESSEDDSSDGFVFVEVYGLGHRVEDGSTRITATALCLAA